MATVFHQLSRDKLTGDVVFGTNGATPDPVTGTGTLILKKGVDIVGITTDSATLLVAIGRAAVAGDLLPVEAGWTQMLVSPDGLTLHYANA